MERMDDQQEKQTKNIDKEWMYLINEARELGVSKEEVRNFLLKNERKPTS